VTDNQQRAADLLATIRSAPGWLHEAYVEVALDAAEARGRAEIVRNIEAVADELERGKGSSLVAGRLRALVHGMTR
jgi:hypothetical protein